MLLADRFARAGSGELFDLATGLDVELETGPGATGAPLVASTGLDAGHLHDGTSFVAEVRAAPDRASALDTREHRSVARYDRLVAEAIECAPVDCPHDILLAEEDERVRQAVLCCAARHARRAGIVPISLDGIRRLHDLRALRGRSVLVIGAARSEAALTSSVVTALAVSAVGANVLCVVRTAQPGVGTSSLPREDRHAMPRLVAERAHDWGARGTAPATGVQAGRASPVLSTREPTCHGAVLQRELQRVRGIARRRDDVDAYLEASLHLARVRLGAVDLQGAAAVAREAWAARCWWGAPWVRIETVERALRLLHAYASARIEGGGHQGVDAELRTGTWAARLLGTSTFEVELRCAWARSYRLRGEHERAARVLGSRWPHESDPVAQVNWAREAVWNAFSGPGSCAAPGVLAELRRLGELSQQNVAREAHAALAVSYLLLGDRVAARAALGGAVARTGPERRGNRRLWMLRAALQSSRSDAGFDPRRRVGHARQRAGRDQRLTQAMRQELRMLSRACGHRGAAVPDDGAVACSGRSESMKDILDLLRLCQEEPPDALERVCGLLRDRLGAAAVGIWTSASSHPLACAGNGRSWPAPLADRARTTGMPHGPEASADAIEAAWPVTHAGAPIGALACRWLPGEPPDRARSDVLLTAAATACAPLVRDTLDQALAPIAPDAFGLVGESRAVQDLRVGIAQAARVPYHVLIEGESGSGKEVVARAVHAASPRRQKRLCAVNCAALTDELLEAELFGHTRGAFTGAITERAGVFEDASGGTLFLDEVADLSPRGQAKVLRVVQDGEIRRLGENFPRRVDVRIVAATNKSLRDQAAQGRFREDLRYRLEVLRLIVPPLRDRPEDVPLLLGHFWKDATARVGSRAVLDRSVVALLARYHWPGNVRELQNVVAAMAVHAPARGRVGPSAIPDTLDWHARPGQGGTLDEARRRFELEYVRLALHRAGGRRAEAARELGLTRQGLAKLLARLDPERKGQSHPA